MMTDSKTLANQDRTAADSYTSSDITVVELRGVERVYRTPAGPVYALRGLDLDIRRATLLAVVGESGSGKSTLLNLLCGVDRATAGTVVVDGTDMNALGSAAAARWRGQNCGVVLQSQQLIPVLTAYENVRLAMDLARTVPKEARETRARDLLEMVGIDGLAERFPDELSGGQQQRVAIARALANRPKLIVADEPTAALDSATSLAIYEVLAQAVDTEGTTVVCSTHSEALAERADRVVRLHDGGIIA